MPGVCRKRTVQQQAGHTVPRWRTEADREMINRRFHGGALHVVVKTEASGSRGDKSENLDMHAGQ